MESVIDKLAVELAAFKDATFAEGGCSDELSIEAVYWGDPGIIPSMNYPCFIIEPAMDTPVSENTGSERRQLEVSIQLLQDARDDFNADVDEANGDRKRVRVMGNLRRWMRRVATRQLDGLDGVLDVTVRQTNYMGQVRGSVIAKSASITLSVLKQYPKQA